MYSELDDKINIDGVTQLIAMLGSLLFTCDLVIDSRKIKKGDIFLAYQGSNIDGRHFIAEAIKKQARFITIEAPFMEQEVIMVDHMMITALQDHIGIIASYKYHNLSCAMRVVGVTGTNGKTTISHWLNQVYVMLGLTTAIIGTTGVGCYGDIKEFNMTTPDAITLQRLIAEFATKHVDILAMEVSSHALAQGRVNGVDFDTAIFTNLTQDHLDYHLTMDNYFNAKKKLFYWKNLKYAIVNLDDSNGYLLYQELRRTRPMLNVLGYGLENGDVKACNIKFEANHTTFSISYKFQQVRVKVPIIGKFNVYNILAVVCDLINRGNNLNQIGDLISKITPVCGRIDTISSKDKPLVVIDYAHTPDALEKVLITLNEIKSNGKIWCVFGCGGDRDREKRPLMGQIASKLADEIIVTSDNPRTEEPMAIINEILQGIENQQNIQVLANRDYAIKYAINTAKKEDIVLIAGKGHETYQEIGTIRKYFSDMAVAKEIMGMSPK